LALNVENCHIFVDGISDYSFQKNLHVFHTLEQFGIGLTILTEDAGVFGSRELARFRHHELSWEPDHLAQVICHRLNMAPVAVVPDEAATRDEWKPEDPLIGSVFEQAAWNLVCSRVKAPRTLFQALTYLVECTQIVAPIAAPHVEEVLKHLDSVESRAGADPGYDPHH
jgi:hypothetical protein